MTTTTLLPDVGVELREGYADVGDDVRLHYVEAGDRDGSLVVLLHGFPEFWFGWRQQIAPLAAAGFRVVAPDTRGYNLSSKPEGFEAYAVDLLAADIRALIGELGAESAVLVGHDWGGSIAWATAMNHPEVVDRLAILNAAHPRRLSEGLHHPSQLRKSWYFFFFAVPGLPEEVVQLRDWHFFRHFLEDANPPYTAGGNRTLRRGVVAARGSGRDDQLLPRLGRQSQKEAAAKLRPISAPTLVIWGEGDSYLGSDLAEPDHDDVPNLDRRAPSRRVPLGPSRRGRTRQPTPHRLLRPRVKALEALARMIILARRSWPSVLHDGGGDVLTRLDGLPSDRCHEARQHRSRSYDVTPAEDGVV